MKTITNAMNLGEFTQRIKEEIERAFPGTTAEEQRIEKIQNQSYNGLYVREGESEIGFVLNMDAYYKQMEDGRSFASIVEEIKKTVFTARENAPEICVNILKDYSKIKDKLIMQLIPFRGNEDMLNKVPFSAFADMVVVYRILLSSDNKGESSILVTNENIWGFGVTPEQLAEDARDACIKNHPLSVRPMQSILFGIPEEDADKGMWVISNKTGRFGASVIAYPGALERIAEKFGSGYYIIPSSVHEVLAIPDGYTHGMTSKDMDEMVVSINTAEVDERERLGTHCYHYDKDAGILETGKQYEARKDGER